MLQIYKMPGAAVKQQKRAVIAAALTLFIGVPLLTIVAGTLFHLDRGTLSSRDVLSIAVMLGIPCTILWLSTNVMKSVQIQLENDRITRIQNHPFAHSILKITFSSQDIGHIREVSKSGLYLRGRNSDGRWADLHVPRSIENYDEIRAHLAAWHPIRKSSI